MNYDRTEMNAFVQAMYDTKMAEGKHGHYETMFHVVHKAIERAAPVSQYLKNGMRFKISGSDRYGAELLGMPIDLIGKWVALVDATDNCHLASLQSECRK